MSLKKLRWSSAAAAGVFVARAGCDASISDFRGRAVSEEVYAGRGKLVYGKQYRVVDLPGLWVAGKHSRQPPVSYF